MSSEIIDVTPFVSEVELQNIRRIFQQFDKDNSDSIDVEELKEVMASLGVLMDERHLMELVEQVTTDGKSELNFDEFLSLITLWKEASQYKLFDGKGFKSLAQQHVERALQTNSLVSDHPWRAAWDVVVCFGALLYWIFCLALDAYGYEKFNIGGLIAGDIVLTLVFLVDAAVSSRTSFLEDVRLQDDPKLVLSHYARTWMIPDLLACIPFDLILGGAGKRTAALVLRHLRLVKLFKIPFLWQPSGSVPITSNYIRFHFHMLPIFHLVLIFVIMVHGFSIGWVLIKQSSCTDVLIDTATCTYDYTPAVYFVLYTLSTVGLGDIPVVGDKEQWYASFVLCGAMATNGIVIGKLVAILQRADIKKERRAKLRETLAVLDHFSIPKQLQEEILQFQAHVFEHNLGAAYEGIVSGLPLEMRTNISLFVKMKLVTNVPMFVESHYMLRIAVAQSLENAVARPEQYIIVCGQESDGLYFLAYGFADVFNLDGSYDGTLRSGDFFGDGALLGERAQIISVKAITYCDLWVLSKAQFTSILKRFPKFRRHVELLKATNPLIKGSDTSGKEGAASAEENKADVVEGVAGDGNIQAQRDDAPAKGSSPFAAVGPQSGGLPPSVVTGATSPHNLQVDSMLKMPLTMTELNVTQGALPLAANKMNSKNVMKLKTILQTVAANKAKLQRALKAASQPQ